VAASSSQRTSGTKPSTRLSTRSVRSAETRQRVPTDRRRSPELAFVEPGFSARGFLGRRHPQQRQIIAALEMRAFLTELFAALQIDQRRDRIGKVGLRDSRAPRCAAPRRRSPSPSPTAAAQLFSRAVDGDQFGGRGTESRSGPRKARRALERSVLVEHHARRRPAPPRGGSRPDCADLVPDIR
jgi:hypothetical protein